MFLFCPSLLDACESLEIPLYREGGVATHFNVCFMSDGQTLLLSVLSL